MESPIHRSRRWPWVAAVWCLALVLAVVVAGVGWFYLRVKHKADVVAGRIPIPSRNTSRDHDRLAIALELTRERRQPLTTAEVRESYRIRADGADLTARWMEVITRFEDDDPRAAELGTDIDAWFKDRTPISDWNAVDDWLAKHREAINALYQVAETPGDARIPIQFEDGFNMSLEPIQHVRQANRALELEGARLAMRGEWDALLRNLKTRRRLITIVEPQPALVSQLVVLVFSGSLARDSIFYVRQAPWSDEQLREVDALLGALDPQQGLRTALVGERAIYYHAMHFPLYMTDDPAERITSLETGRDIDKIARWGDCAFGLSLFEDALMAADLPFPQAMREAEGVENQLARAGRSGSTREKLEFTGTVLYAPAFANSFAATARGLAVRDLARCGVAITRYERQKQQLPSSLNDLIPDFLPSLPRDPYDGQPLRYQSTETAIKLYAVGPDQVDDGGEGNWGNGLSDGAPDLVVELAK